MEDYKGVAALILKHSVSKPLVNENNILPQQLYVHNEICECVTVYEFLDKALKTVSGSTFISWMEKDPLSLPNEKHSILRTCNKATVNRDCNFVSSLCVCHGLFRFPHDNLFVDGKRCLQDDEKLSILRTCDKATAYIDGNFVCSLCFCHGLFRFPLDYFFVDGKRCTDLQSNGIKWDDRLNVRVLKSNLKTDFLYAWLGQSPPIIHDLNLDFHFERDDRDTTHPKFGTNTLQGEVVALLQSDISLLSITLETMQILVILLAKVSMSRDGSIYEGVLRIGDIVNVQFEKIEGFKMWFIVNAWIDSSSINGSVPSTLVNRQEIISSEPVNLINEMEIEGKYLENSGSPLSDGGSFDDDYVIYSPGGEEGQLLCLKHTKGKKMANNAVILCQGKKVFLNWTNLFINEEQCKHAEFSSALTQNDQVLKVEAVSHKVLGKPDLFQTKFGATCAWFGQKPSLEKIITPLNSIALCHLHDKRVSGTVVKIALPYVAIISVQDGKRNVHAVLYTAGLKIGRNGMKVRESVFMSTYLHVGDRVQVTLKTQLGKTILKAVKAEYEANLKITGTICNDHATTLSSETNARNNDEESLLSSRQSLVSETYTVDSSLSIAEEMKVSTDYNPLYFFGHGVHFDTLSPTQAILKVQQHPEYSVNIEYDVLIDKDIIFVNQMRCNSFEEIQGITVALHCFRMKEKLCGVSYRAMAAVSVGCSVLKTIKRVSIYPKTNDYKFDGYRMHEGIVIGYGTDALAIVEIKEGNVPYLVLCYKACFTSKEAKEAKFIFECVTIGEKVSLKIIFQKSKRFSYYVAIAVSQESNLPTDNVCLSAKDDASNSNPVFQSAAHDLKSEETNDGSLIRASKTKPVFQTAAHDLKSEETNDGSLIRASETKPVFQTAAHDLKSEETNDGSLIGASKTNPVFQSATNDLKSEETDYYGSMIRITKEAIEFRINAEHVLVVDHGCDLPIHSIMPLTAQKPFLPFFNGQGVLVHQLSSSQGIMIAKPSGKEVRFAVIIHDNDIFVNKERCEGLDKLRGKYMNVNCIRTEMNALGISYKAISAFYGSKLPHLMKRFNLAQPKSIEIDETKVYKGEVTAFASFTCAIVEIIENNTSHLVSLKRKSLVNCPKILVNYLRIGGKLNLKITTQKEDDNEIYYTAALAIKEGYDLPAGSSCTASALQTCDNSVSSAQVAPNDNRSKVMKDDQISNSEVVSSKEDFHLWTLIPDAVDNNSQVQEDQHSHDGSHKIDLKPDEDLMRASSALLNSENLLNNYLSELNEVLGVVTSHKSHSEGIVMIDTLDLKVEFSINNLVWWEKSENMEAKVLSVQDLFPLNSLLMVCAVSAPGGNNFRATKVWKPSSVNFCE